MEWFSFGGSCLYPFYSMCVLGATTTSQLSYEAYTNHISKGVFMQLWQHHHVGSYVLRFAVALLIHILSCGCNYHVHCSGVFAVDLDGAREILFRLKRFCLVNRMIGF